MHKPSFSAIIWLHQYFSLRASTQFVFLEKIVSWKRCRSCFYNDVLNLFFVEHTYPTVRWVQSLIINMRATRSVHSHTELQNIYSLTNECYYRKQQDHSKQLSHTLINGITYKSISCQNMHASTEMWGDVSRLWLLVALSTFLHEMHLWMLKDVNL